MADETTEPTADLARRVRELEEENARLSAASRAAEATEPRRRGMRRGWWRAPVSALCIVVAAVLVPVSVIAGWARAELVDEDRFVAMLAPIAQDPSVQNLVIDETMTAIDQKVDFEQITGNVIDGIKGLGLPPRAGDALDLLRQPAANGLESLVRTGVTRVVQSDAFANTWATAVRAAHRVVSNVATPSPDDIVVLTDQGLGVRLGPIVDQVKSGLEERGLGAASLIPSVDRTIIVGTGDSVVTIRLVYGVAVAAGTWVPLVTLAIFVIGILIARRRSLAVVGTGIAVAVGGGSLALGFTIGSLAVASAAQSLDLSPTAFGVVYEALISDMQHTATVVALLGVFLAILGWAMGGWSSSRRLRALIGGLNTSGRIALARRGLDTGRIGDFLWRSRTLVRVVIIVLAVLWLLLLRPLSGGDIALVVIVAVAVAWILELLQRRPGEVAVAEASGVDAAGAEATLVDEIVEAPPVEEVVVVEEVELAEDGAEVSEGSEVDAPAGVAATAEGSAASPRTTKASTAAGRGPVKGRR